jgi:hypothetical protein
MKFTRKPFTDWEIKLRLINNNTNKTYEGGADFGNYTVVYRTTYRRNKECEQFTLLPKEEWGNMCLIQIQIFKDGSVNIENHIDCNIFIDQSSKTIEINMLCDIDYDYEHYSLVIVYDYQ